MATQSNTKVGTGIFDLFHDCNLQRRIIDFLGQLQKPMHHGIIAVIISGREKMRDMLMQKR